MNAVQQYEELKRKVDRAKREANQAEGALSQLKAQLKELGVTSSKQAKKMLATLEEEKEQLGEEFLEKMEAFTDRYGDLLG